MVRPLFTVLFMWLERVTVQRWVARVAVVACAVASWTAVPAVTGTAPPAAADPPRADWAKLRMCESSNRYTINTGTGYYGAYQFDLPTWRSVGGKGYPHQASPREQDYRALYLYRMRGWQPWECARPNFLNLKEDRSARSKIKPTYAEAAYIGGSSVKPSRPKPSRPGTGPATMPKWPGVVYAFGDCSPHLRKFQLRMNKFGYDFQGTGCYYDETKRAVLDLQRANGIKDSGRLGPKTWRAAWKGKPPRGSAGAKTSSKAVPKWPGVVYAFGDCSPHLRKFQLRMNKFGYDFQGTGCYYDETKRAVLDLQRANGIKDSGRLGPKTWRAAWLGKPPR